MLAGSLGVPLTAILFCLEVTHCLPALLPLTIVCIAAYLITALLMPRSILTEKITRRGFHLTREYGVDPLEIVMVRERMKEIPSVQQSVAQGLPELYAFADATCRNVAEIMATEGVTVLPVLDRATQLPCGEITIHDLLFSRGSPRQIRPPSR
jgi:chloride channel protein, CIC family